MNTIGTRLREARLAADLTMQELADKAHLPRGRSDVYRYETGERTPSLQRAGALAQALGVSKGWLVFGEGQRKAGD